MGDSRERISKMQDAKRGRRELRAILERLRTWYESDKALADQLDTTKSWVRAIANDEDRSVGEERAQAVIDLHDAIEDRVVAADKAAIQLVQAMNWIEENVLTKEQVHLIGERWSRVRTQIQELKDELDDK